MSYLAKTVFGFGLYMLLLCVPLLFAPNLLLELLGFAPTSEVWVRVLGQLVLYAVRTRPRRERVTPTIVAVEGVRR